ncbi:MAG: DUF4375 domain-containing protein, partial [Planctomycetaceae bacterium]|nr:DUF4375 domain-containing protein [Planctomycetaceae bacterium]
MSSVDNLPRLNLIDFYRLHGGEFFLLITTAVERLLEQFPDAELPDELTAIYGWRQLDVEIRNGGCVQYFNDHAGEPGTEELAQLLDQLELEEASELIWDVIGLIDDLEDDFEDADYEE